MIWIGRSVVRVTVRMEHKNGEMGVMKLQANTSAHQGMQSPPPNTPLLKHKRASYEVL